MVTSPRQLLGTFGAQRLWQLNLQSNHNDFIFGGLNNKCRRPGVDPWGRNIPWRREQLPTPVFLPGEFHGQRSLVGYSPWGCRESDTTEQLNNRMIDYRNWAPRWYSGKESACQCRRCKIRSFNPWVGKIPWSRKWQPTPVFLFGKSHWQRNLAGYSPRRCKGSDMI